jgi:threonyl-tRNA synthetase
MTGVESIGKKIRDNEIKKIPFMLIVGEKEHNDQTIAVRKQGSGDQGSQTVTEFVNLIKSQL